MFTNTYDRVTERILELLDKGVCPWRRPWSTNSVPPQNFATRRHYSGTNFFLLSCTGYQSPYFMTFRQVQELDGNVKKGSHGFPVVYWGTMDSEAKTKQSKEPSVEGKETGTKAIPFLRSYTVFNAAQIEGVQFPDPTGIPVVPFNPIERAEEIVTGWKDGPKVEMGMSHACYDVTSDVIHLPPPEDFDRPESYYCTRFHEMAHATGAPHRLNRTMLNKYGSAEYSREELVAEMSSAFLCAKCGIDNVVIESQAAYLQGWMKALRSDPKLIVTAAGHAQRAVNLIQGITYEPVVERVPEASGQFTAALQRAAAQHRNAPHKTKGREIEM